MQKINEKVEKVYGKYPQKVLQIGEGNFLRAFADWMIDEANERGDFKGSILLCCPIKAGMEKVINEQDGLYTLIMRGIEDKKPISKTRQITSVSKCINPYQNFEDFLEAARNPDIEVVISNTTEAGIAYNENDKQSDTPPSSFPAKITVLLYERFKTFKGSLAKGLLFLPVELIDNNGIYLKKYVLQYARQWKLGDDFIAWIEKANKWTNTLVDRIVTGYPKDDIESIKQNLGYEDNLVVTCELFNLWVIEGKKEWADIFPIHKGKANVLWTEDVKPYKMRKVRILNGAHTATVPAAFLAGHNFVLDFINDEVFKNYLNKILFEEVIPTLDLPKADLESFANNVFARFSNPYIKHSLLDISLNCSSKFNARCLPTILEYKKRMSKLPKLLTFSFAAFIKFYLGEMLDGKFTGKRENGETYQIKDNAEVLEFFESFRNKNLNEIDLVSAVLSNQSLWDGKDLTEIDGLSDAVADNLKKIKKDGIKETIKSAVCDGN
ncbi:MAG: tagaturonate reductase [Elusimicrobiota bacterium]|jgi:tagaturonate reductase|nr:tagaturonate reductase [Elusimicrobiota bacterium]